MHLKNWWKKANNSISLESQIQPGLRVNPALPGFEAAPLAAPLWGFGHRLASQISQRGSRGIGGEQQEQYKQTKLTELKKKQQTKQKTELQTNTETTADTQQAGQFEGIWGHWNEEWRPNNHRICQSRHWIGIRNIKQMKNDNPSSRVSLRSSLLVHKMLVVDGQSVLGTQLRTHWLQRLMMARVGAKFCPEKIPHLNICAVTARFYLERKYFTRIYAVCTVLSWNKGFTRFFAMRAKYSTIYLQWERAEGKEENFIHWWFCRRTL